jgi:putative DNA methylase
MHLFGRQAIPMAWDFAEANILGDVVGGLAPAYQYIAKCIEKLCPNGPGSVQQISAQSISYPNGAVISTDPPYYDNIGYADLSDFFFCWLKKTLKEVYPGIFSSISTPKSEELIASPHRHGGPREAEKFFIEGMTDAIKNMATGASNDFPVTIYYAFKQSEIDKDGLSSVGWSTFLQAVISAGFSVTGTWPLRTEQTFRMRGMGANALANSVVLVCRKKEASAEIITRAEFIRELKRELPPAIKELQSANIAPADMPQSAIGPGMGVFSRYNAVLESDDSPMSVKTALQLINRELD